MRPKPLLAARLVWVAILALPAPAAAQSAMGPTPPKPQEEAPPAERPGPLDRRAEAQTSRDFVRLAFNFYDQKDGGGNPREREDVTVLEPAILLSKALDDRWTLTLKGQADAVTAASAAKGAGPTSGASKDQYFGVELGAFYAWSDQTTVGGGVTFSTERDYRSVGAFTKWSYTTEDRNDTFVVKAAVLEDDVDVILFDGTSLGTDARRSLSLGVGWTHVLGPQTVATLNWDLTSQAGFLATPYNSVVIAGAEVPEALPDSRLRNAFHVRVRHLLFDDLAIEPGIGLYFDDWGATAFNVELAAYWEAIPDALIVRPSYRFHAQTEVDAFVSGDLATVPDFRTQDSDLAAFTGHTFGLKLVLLHPTFLGENMEIEIGGDFTLRSDGLDSFSFTIGYQWRF